MNQKELEQRLAAFVRPRCWGRRSVVLSACLKMSFQHSRRRCKDTMAKLGRHGLRFEILREQGGRSLVFVYWTQRLQARLARPAIMQILRPLGYRLGGR